VTGQAANPDNRGNAVTNKKSSVVYIDHTVLCLLSERVLGANPSFDDWNATSILWRNFREEKIRLVTHGKETEMDIILWLNRQGCCITDTLRAMEAIKEFELWNKVEKSHVQKFKQVLTLFEELELLHLPAGNYEGYPTHEEIAGVLKLKSHELDRDYAQEDDFNLLRECLTGLNDWYTEDLWNDLKRTDYQLNWQILESVLSRHGIEPVFHGAEGTHNRHLFGLLTRAVGLTKKSCGRLPVPDSHINFVLNMVHQKYSHDQFLSGIRHLLHCIRHHINFYVTINHDLIQGFSKNRTALQGYLQIPPLTLEMMSPRGFVSEVLGVQDRT
jgi:hypothetical protein